MKGGTKHFTAAAIFATVGFLIVAHFDFGSTLDRFQMRRVETVARALGFAFSQQELRSDGAAEDQAQRFAEAIPKNVEGVQTVLLLKRTKFVAHSNPELAGQSLDRDSMADKRMYDTAKSLDADVKKNVEERSRNPELGERNAFEEIERLRRDGRLAVSIPVKEDGRMRVMARAVATPLPVDRRIPWQIPGLALALIAFFALVGARLPASIRLPAGAVLLAGLVLAQAWSYQAWEDEVRQDLGQKMVQTYGQLGRAGLLGLSVEPEQSAQLGPMLAIRANGLPALDLVQVRSATVAGELADATRFDADGVAVFFSQAFMRPGGPSPDYGLTLWAIGFGLIAGGLFILGMVGLLRRARDAAYQHRGAYAYMSPAMIGMLVLVFVPVVYGIALGFQKRQYNEFEFSGLANFVQILSDFDVSHPENFYFTLGVTILWTVSNVVLHVSIGLFLALLLNDQFLKAKGIFRVILILPWAVPNYITALIWKGMYHKQFGAVNIFLESLGFEPVAWFGSFWPAFFTNLSTNTWLGFPFMMVVSLGALQSIPTDLYEAAIVDGASRWQRFKKITFPLLMPALVPAVIVGTVWTFNMFNIIYLVSGGAPNGATDILITDAFRWAFERDRPGYAAAYSTIIFVILAVFTTITNRITGATKGAFD